MKKKQGKYLTFFLLPENYQIIEKLEKEIADRRLFNKTVRKHTVLNFLLENLDFEDIKKIFQERISENLYKFEDCTARVRSQIQKTTKNLQDDPEPTNFHPCKSNCQAVACQSAAQMGYFVEET